MFLLEDDKMIRGVVIRKERGGKKKRRTNTLTWLQWLGK
jgi:hypothetical protein